MDHNAMCFIIICFYPDEKHVTRLIRTLRPWRVLVVDNTPHHDSFDFVQRLKKDKHVTFIQTQKNLGYAGGVNRGLARGTAGGADWMVLLNQDIQIDATNIDLFIRFLLHTQPGICGPFAGGLDRHRWTTQLPSERIEYISGACMAIHRNVIEKVGLLHEPYFMYYEDADYCVRARRTGFPLVHTPINGIRHESNAASLGGGSYLHTYYLARNHLLFVERLAPLHVKLYEYVRLGKSVLESNISQNKGMLDGLLDYLLRRFGGKKI